MKNHSNLFKLSKVGKKQVKIIYHLWNQGILYVDGWTRVLRFKFKGFFKKNTNDFIRKGILYKEDPDSEPDLQKKRTPDL